MNKTKERALEILDLYVSGLNQFSFLKSVILVGSLSDDTYTGHLGSDIDLVHIIDEENYSENKAKIKTYIQKIEEETLKDVPFSKMIFSLKDLTHPYNDDFELSEEHRDMIERPVEVLRIKDTGKTIYGEDLIHQIEMPEKEDLIQRNVLDEKLLKNMALLYPKFYEEYQKNIQNPSTRILVQIVMTKAMSDYYFHTLKNCSSKYRILECVKQDYPELSYLSLLEKCHQFRFKPDSITKSDINIMHEEYQKYKSAILTKKY